MVRPTIRAAVEWIAYNDDAGNPDALDVEVVRGYISTLLAADLFGVEPLKLANKIVALRKAKEATA